jgi:hypothetical protein
MRSSVSIVTLQEYEEVMGAQKLYDLLRSFSCPLNREVELYLKDTSRAVQSSRMSSSVTYLAFDSKTNDLLGYFTVMMKAYSVGSNALNSANKRLISRFSEIDSSGNFTASVYLIAQIGKNFALPKDYQIEGSELLWAAMDVFRATKSAIGGKLVMIEREAEEPKLLEFYKANGFKSWTTRRNAKDGVVYDQMFASL